MKNYVQPGEVITVTAPYAREGGQGMKVGQFFGVATSDVAINEPAELKLTGVFDLDKVNAQAWTAGQLVYWDDAAKLVTSTAAGNLLIGAAMRVEANPTDLGRVRLNGTVQANEA